MIDALGSLINQLSWANRDAVRQAGPPRNDPAGPVQI